MSPNGDFLQSSSPNTSLDTLPFIRLHWKVIRKSQCWQQGVVELQSPSQFSSVQFNRSVVSDSLWPHELQHARHPCPSPTPEVHPQLLKSTQTYVHCVGDAIQLSHPLFTLLLLPSIFPSISVFSNESALCTRWPKYWSFSFNISPSNEQPGLISFRMDWLDLLAVQGTLNSLIQHHSSKASILWIGLLEKQ